MTLVERGSRGTTITLKLFGSFRRYLPAESEGHACQVRIPRGAAVGHVLAHFGVPSDGTVTLVNGRSADLEQRLDEDDVLAAFPALAGG